MNAFDPYRQCDGSCTHDLGRGVLVSELLSRDGPFPAVQLVVTVGARRGWLLDRTARALPAAG